MDRRFVSALNSWMTPQKTELLVSGFCNKLNYLPLEVIQICLAFFNDIIYWKIFKTNIKNICLYDDKPNFDLDGWKDCLLQHLIMRFQSNAYCNNKIKTETNFDSNICIPVSGWSNNNIFYDPFINQEYKFDIEIYHGDIIKLKLNTDWKTIKKIVCRIQIYCLETKIGFEKICIFTSDNIMRVGDYKLLYLSKKDFINNESIQITMQIELVRITFFNGIIRKYWSKSLYPWNEDNNDKQLFLKNKWFANYFNKRCFGINGEYYLEVDSFTNNNVYHHIGDLIKLKHDIILFSDDIRKQLLSNYVKLDWYWNTQIHERNCTQFIQENINKKKKEKWKQYYYAHHSNTTHKLSKLYRNSKRKYQYNRW